MEPRPLLETRFRVHVSEQSDGDHWSGGPAYHRGAICPACELPLLLLWDINCKDSRFPQRKFGPLERLPLYFCWGCVNDLSYQLVSGNELRIFSGEQRKGLTFPYQHYPTSFERKALALDSGVPDEIRHLVQKIYSRIGNNDAPSISSKERKVLRDFFGHPVISEMCTVHHQLGGKPLSLYWAMEVFNCPNPACRNDSEDGVPRKKRAMKFVAGIINDPWGGLPMVDPATKETKKDWDYFVSVQFHICDRCWMIYGCNRCD
jgi:hypothetical protein